MTYLFPFLGVTFAALSLIKLGALGVMTQALSVAVVVLLAVIISLVALLALTMARKHRAVRVIGH